MNRSYVKYSLYQFVNTSTFKLENMETDCLQAHKRHHHLSSLSTEGFEFGAEEEDSRSGSSSFTCS